MTLSFREGYISASRKGLNILDNTLIIQQFEKIEEQVEKLIGDCKSQKETNCELERRIEELETTLKQKEELEIKLTDERGAIRSKVDGLLSKLKDVTTEANSDIQVNMNQEN